MRVLITGAAGFIGSHLVSRALGDGFTVRAIDNLATGHLWRIERFLPDLEWVNGDIRDADLMSRVVAGVDVVLHHAALPSVSRSIADPVASTSTNVGGTITLLKACRDAGVKRVVYAGSSSAYGDTPTLPKVETMPPRPMSPYAVDKLAGEYYCRVFHNLGFLETICFRYFNVFGPAQDPNAQYAAVIPKFITSIGRGEPVPINGDGSQSRDFTYVSNVVDANIRAIRAPAGTGGVFNVACGSRYDLRALVRELADIMQVDPVVEYQPRRAGDVSHSLADISEAERALGYQPVVSFRDGLRQTVEWFQGDGAKQFGLPAAACVTSR
ncbi:MAG: SDR family oxidoreductase [Armatimonadota bacterium]